MTISRKLLQCGSYLFVDKVQLIQAAYSPTLNVYVMNYYGSTGAFYTSVDGVKWVKSAQTTYTGVVGVQWLPSAAIFIAFYSPTSDGTSWLPIYSVDGYNWTAGTISGNWRNMGNLNWGLNVTWNGSKYVAFIPCNAYNAQSTDGKNWTVVTPSVSDRNSIYGYECANFVGYVNGVYLAADQFGIFVSADATTWTANFSGGAGNASPFANYQLSYVSIVSDGVSLFSMLNPGGMVWTTKDGKTFSSSTISSLNSSQYFPVGVAYGNGTFVSAWSYGTMGGIYLYYSSDGKTWTAAASFAVGTTYVYPYTITWTGSQFMCIGSSSIVAQRPYILTSPDGITWKRQ